jgi:hypothetical protein
LLPDDVCYRHADGCSDALLLDDSLPVAAATANAAAIFAGRLVFSSWQKIPLKCVAISRLQLSRKFFSRRLLVAQDCLFWE